MLLPIGKRVLVAPYVEERKSSILILEDEIPKKYIVQEIGDEVTKVKIGDIIIIAPYSAQPFDVDNEKYYLIDEACVLARFA